MRIELIRPSDSVPRRDSAGQPRLILFWVQGSDEPLLGYYEADCVAADWSARPAGGMPRPLSRTFAPRWRTDYARHCSGYGCEDQGYETHLIRAWTYAPSLLP